MKAQFWSIDVIFAIVLFSIAIVIITFVWYSISNQFAIANGYGVGSMQAQLQGLESRIVSQGHPSYWNSAVDVSNTITWANMSVGLADGQGSLSTGKIMTLMAMASTNYQATKQDLGVGYDYYIVIKSNTFNVNMGLNPKGHNATSIQVATLPIVAGGSPGYMQLLVWTNTTFGVT